MRYVYRWRRYLSDMETPCITLSDAINNAIAGLNSGEEWPERIIDNQDGVTLWQESDPTRTRESLRVFAHANGVEMVDE